MTRTKLCLAIAIAFAVTLSNTTLQAFEKTPSVDGWASADGNFSSFQEDDGISVWSFAGGGDAALRYGIVEFDLTDVNVTVVEAYLGFWSQINGSDSTEAHIQLAYNLNAMDVNGSIPTASLTWGEMNASRFDVNESTLFETFGTLTTQGADNNASENQTYLTTSASVADLALINAEAAGDNLLTVLLVSDDSNASLVLRRSWGDGFFSGPNDSKLFLNEPFTQFDLGDFNKDGNITTADFDIMKANWLTIAGPALNEDGEVTGDGLVTLADFALFKNSLFPGGATAFASATGVPEPTTMLLLMAALPACLMRRTRRS